MYFATFIPTFGNKNPNVKYFAYLDDGTKKELKQLEDDVYYYCDNGKRNYVKISGDLYHKVFTKIRRDTK